MSDELARLRAENERLAAECAAWLDAYGDEQIVPLIKPRVAAVLAGYRWAQHDSTWERSKSPADAGAWARQDRVLEKAFRQAEAAVKGAEK